MKYKTKHGLFFRFGVFIFSALIVGMVLRSVNAGSLSPSSAPASTLYTLGQLFNPLASTSYDSSGITADSQGSAIQIGRCIIQKLHGGTC